MTIKLVTATGTKKTGTLKVPEAKLSGAGVSRAVRAALANGRRNRPLVKTRGMVRGGGAKPWRQKGTGRARAGTNRSPLWRGGGITFGPSGQPRARQRLPRSVRRAALATTLGTLATADRLTVVSGTLSLAQSKAAAGLLAQVAPEGSALFVVTGEERPQVRGVRNLARVTLATTDDCTVAELIRCDQVILSEAAFTTLTVVGARPARDSAAGPSKSAKQLAKPGSAAAAAKKPVGKSSGGPK